MRAVITLIYCHFKSWRLNYHVLAAFLFGIGLCLKNCYGYLSFANGIGSPVNIFEPYIIIGSRIPFLMGILLGNLLLLSDAPFLSSVSPFGAAFLTVVFNSLYMVFIGVCIFVVNLACSAGFGWIVAALVHMAGYIVYANGGFLIPFRYSLLCRSAPAYHYIGGLKMPSGCSFGIFLTLIISIVCIGRYCISKSLE